MTVLLGRHTEGVNNRDASQIYFQPDDSCRGTDHDSNTISLVTSYNQCGTTIRETDTEIIFSNILTNREQQPSSAIISRESVLLIPVHCNLTKKHLLEASEYVPKIGVITFEEEGFGSFSMSLNRYSDRTFSSPLLASGLEVEMDQDMWYAVSLTSVPDLGVVLTTCWATTTPNPEDSLHFVLIQKKCGMDNTINFYRNLGLKKDGFSFKAFHFVGNYKQVYIHCEAIVGTSRVTAESRAEGCTNPGRRRRSLPGDRMSRPYTLSSPAIVLTNPSQTTENEDKVSGTNQRFAMLEIGIGATIVFIVVFIAFVRGLKHYCKRD